jgi:hypothetical protein
LRALFYYEYDGAGSQWLMQIALKETQIYMHLCNFSSEEYLSAVAKTIGEARELIESSFSFVCDMDGVKLLSKRK